MKYLGVLRGDTAHKSAKVGIQTLCGRLDLTKGGNLVGKLEPCLMSLFKVAYLYSILKVEYSSQ